MSRKWKKISCVFLAFLMLVSLAGCKKDGEVVGELSENTEGGAENENKAMGRYVEKEMSLPENMDQEQVMLFENNQKGEPTFYCYNKSGKEAAFSTYSLKKDGTYEQKEIEWLNSLKLKSKGLHITYVNGKDGNAYAAYRISTDPEKVPQSIFVKSKDGKTAEPVNIPEAEETVEYGYKLSVSNIGVLENGNILIMTFGDVILFDGASGRRIESNNLKDAGSSKLMVLGNTYYILEQGAVRTYDGATGKELESIPIEVSEIYGAHFLVKPNENCYLVSEEGIQLKKKGADLWEMVVDGSLNTLGAPKYHIKGFEAGEKNEYYVYFGSMEDKQRLVQYVYDENMPAEPEITLQIFSMTDSSVVRQAISQFQSQNPNVKVELSVAASEDAAAGNEDYIRAFNTELLAGKGPDLLLLDGLSEDAYIEKGVLLDLKDLLSPLVDSGDLLPGVAASHEKDGKIYSIATRMKLPMAYGTKEAVLAAQDLKSLGKFVKDAKDQSVLGIVDPSMLLSFYYPICEAQLRKQDGQIEEEKLKEFLSDLKTVVDGSVMSDQTQEKYPSSDWDLLYEGNQLYVTQTEGFFHAQSPVSVIDLMGGVMDVIQESYVPMGKIGINSAGKNIELSKSFVKTLFSKEVQSADFYDGFSVNKNVLSDYRDKVNKAGEAYGGSFAGADGKNYEMKIAWPEEERRIEIITACETVTRKVEGDQTILSAIQKESGDYFTGERSLDDTVLAIINKTKLYLQE